MTRPLSPRRSLSREPVHVDASVMKTTAIVKEIVIAKTLAGDDQISLYLPTPMVRKHCRRAGELVLWPARPKFESS